MIYNWSLEYNKEENVNGKVSFYRFYLRKFCKITIPKKVHIGNFQLQIFQMNVKQIMFWNNFFAHQKYK